MSNGFIDNLKSQEEIIPQNALFLPLIDARRMEVYMALFTVDNKIHKDT